MYSGRIRLLTAAVVTVLLVMTSLIHITGSSAYGAAFSGPLEDFIKEGKRIKVVLREELAEISFTPREEAEYQELIEQTDGRLGKDRVYTLRVGEGVKRAWAVQVFASAEEGGAEEIREQLLAAGYGEPYLVRADGLFKVRLGNFTQESSARRLADKLENEGWSSWVLSVPGEAAGGLAILVYDDRNRLVVSGRRLRIRGLISLEQGLYPGETEFELFPGGIRVSNLTSLSQLLPGLLAGNYPALTEIDPSSRYEALKALAVLARTELIYRVTEGGRLLKDSTYQGRAGIEEAVIRAVTATGGQILEGEEIPVTGELSPGKLIPLAGRGADYRTILQELYPEALLVDLSKFSREELLTEATVFSGLKYREISRLSWWGPRNITILDLDLKSEGFILEPVLAGEMVKGLGDLSELVRENKALAGVNGGFYSYTGTPLGLLIKDGLLVSEPIKARAAFGITPEGGILIDRVDWQGYLLGEDGSRVRIDGVNRPPGNDQIVVFNRYYAEEAPPLQEGCRELVLINNRVRELGTGPDGRGREIPPEGLVVQAKGSRAELLKPFQPGLKVVMENNFLPDWEKAGVGAAIGAGPQLLREGKVFITADEEDFQPDISSGRAPRSALGVTADRHLIIVTVDGRQPEDSIGMTLEELAALLLELGVETALNLDGGSSARMVVRGFTMNNPLGERLLSNGLLIKNIYAR